MVTYLLAVSIILLLMLGWVAIQRLARLFAARHPEFGPFREDGSGCDTQCGGCAGGYCLNDGKDE